MTQTIARVTDRSLDDFGNAPHSYAHVWKGATPRDPILLPETIFKWYHVHRDERLVPDEMDVEARAVLADAMADGAWDPSYGLNFALLHLTPTHAFLIACIWRGHQELWARHYVMDVAANGPFIRLDVTGQDAPLACVWELGVICHERMAWHRYLFSDRTDAAKRAWLEDVYRGQV